VSSQPGPAKPRSFIPLSPVLLCSYHLLSLLTMALILVSLEIACSYVVLLVCFLQEVGTLTQRATNAIDHLILSHLPIHYIARQRLVETKNAWKTTHLLVVAWIIILTRVTMPSVVVLALLLPQSVVPFRIPPAGESVHGGTGDRRSTQEDSPCTCGQFAAEVLRDGTRCQFGSTPIDDIGNNHNDDQVDPTSSPTLLHCRSALARSH
jgi:hypothetical protein